MPWWSLRVAEGDVRSCALSQSVGGLRAESDPSLGFLVSLGCWQRAHMVPKPSFSVSSLECETRTSLAAVLSRIDLAAPHGRRTRVSGRDLLTLDRRYNRRGMVSSASFLELKLFRIQIRWSCNSNCNSVLHSSKKKKLVRRHSKGIEGGGKATTEEADRSADLASAF